jgi:hypothetical protein
MSLSPSPASNTQRATSWAKPQTDPPLSPQIPKREAAKNKYQNRGVFFRPKDMAAEAPHSPHRPPQIHHDLPSKKHHKFAKPPAKTPLHHSTYF